MKRALIIALVRICAMIGQTKKIIEDLGTKIIQCREKCEGINNNQKEGYYPRAFFLDQEDDPQVEILIVGENPGNSNCLEREFYKTLAERNEDKIATFKDCQRVWRSIAKQHDYYQRPKHLLKELGLSLNGILWAEVVFCEKSPSSGKLPETFKTCSDRFLKEIVKLLPERKYLVCLGMTALKYVIKLTNSNQWKVIGVYHPTGSRVFANYFEKKGRVTERKLKKKILKSFKELEDSHEPYVCKVKANEIENLSREIQ